jgi:D-threo-aldose 1-dehydrogenase
MGFGAAPIGNIFRPISEEDSAALIKAAWDAGVR